MSSADRIAQIRSLLEAAFAPVELDIEDDGHLHEGHAGARSGKGHFSVWIVSKAFQNKRLLERHRMVFEALGEMMLSDIHALKISAQSPDSEMTGITAKGTKL